MADYYTVLMRKIRETRDDPARVREVVYEAARLALRRQVQVHRPLLSFIETKRQISELEDAIARLEADAAGPGGHGDNEAAVGFEASWQGRNALVSEEDDAPAPIEELPPEPLDPPPAEPAEGTGSRELILVPERAGPPAYFVNPADFINPDVTYRLAVAPRFRARMVMSGLRVAFQLAIAALAVAAFYVAMWGRNSQVQTAREIPPAGEQTSSVRPVAQPPDGTAAQIAIAPVAAALPFPRPTAYGVYAIGDNQLIELESIQATPVDPRTRSQLQIAKPARTVIAAAKLAFVVFRRDLVSSAPEKVPVRIASRIAHSMIFDSTGKPVVTTPATDTWLIREHGYGLRVSPSRESAEMVMLRPEDPDFSFPSGRYELMLGGQAYDFVVAGEVTDPAHCVEGVATVRGPAFYECKPLR
jgi:hypothetical protein